MMKARLAAVIAALLALPLAAVAQDETTTDEALQDPVLGEVGHAKGAILRGLDKVDGYVVDMELTNGSVAEIGRLSVELRECRYPAGDAVADAYALMTIREISTKKVIFSGWMLASSPALNALEHQRYDVWVLRCMTE